MQRLFKISLLLILLFSGLNLYSQINDEDLLKNADFHDHHFDKRKVKFMLPDTKNPIVKYNPLSLSIGTMFYFYQGLISVQFSTNCMYNPSCSEFGVQMIKHYGVLKGVPLAIDRLMRCNKLGAIDVHPLKIDMHEHKVNENIEDYKTHKD